MLADADTEGATLNRHASYDVVNTALDQIAQWIANFLQNPGYGALPVPASKKTSDEKIAGIFSQNLGALAAALHGPVRCSLAFGAACGAAVAIPFAFV